MTSCRQATSHCLGQCWPISMSPYGVTRPQRVTGDTVALCWAIDMRLHLSFVRNISWWRHQMGAFSALLALCAGNSPVPVDSPHKGQWRGALMFSLICVSINGRVNNREAGDLRRYHGHYDVILMMINDMAHYFVVWYAFVRAFLKPILIWLHIQIQIHNNCIVKYNN